MKIEIKKIPLEGLVMEDKINPLALGLDTDIIKFKGPLGIKAFVEKITNAVSVNLDINGVMRISCSRCLDEFEADFKKNLKLFYPVEKADTVVDLDPDIKEEAILDYPIKPLCRPDCQGLCPKCGEKLNEGKCKC